MPSVYAPQPIGDQTVELGFADRAGRCRLGNNRFSSAGCRSCRDMEGCLNWGMSPIFPGLPSAYAPQPISDRPVGLGFPHRAKRCLTGRTRFSSPRCRSCRDMEGCMNRGWGPIHPGLPSAYAPQPISDRPVGLGFPHRAGQCLTGRTRFSSPWCRSCGDTEGCMNRG